jgi:hypothetical protein
MSSDDKEKERSRAQSDAVRFKIMDDRLEQISKKLDDIRILLFVIALPTIIGVIGLIIYLLRLATLFS